jgi:L,D-peptidoglycan transpeptidase YkuD (ErfK/YbiS/YcfS/YnhG family)
VKCRSTWRWPALVAACQAASSVLSASRSSTSENLAEHGAVYDYALVMGVNSQRVPGGGSASFVHVTNGAPTVGCVAIPASTLASILRWVGPSTVIALSPR